MATQLNKMQGASLESLEKKELHDVMDRLEIKYLQADTNSILIEKIVESGKHGNTFERGTGKVKIKDGTKVHPLLGKYISVRVHPTESSNQNSSVFVSINLYTVEFQPNTIVSLPIKVVKFLKNAGKAEHYFDKSVVSENGNLGAHMTRTIPQYVVEVVSDELEQL